MVTPECGECQQLWPRSSLFFRSCCSLCLEQASPPPRPVVPSFKAHVKLPFLPETSSLTPRLNEQPSSSGWNSEFFQGLCLFRFQNVTPPCPLPTPPLAPRSKHRFSTQPLHLRPLKWDGRFERQSRHSSHEKTANCRGGKQTTSLGRGTGWRK